ncbi:MULTISPECIES: hypothetical protein [Kingella]|uniref:hypothetical protein n=1 Tax=Kingella TaxID=32257 RepID=UPI0013DF6D5D|nr:MULTISPECIES: hypothetical protein [Kingella]MBD3614223.1 hypothetical protein [Kingella kingae]MBD3632831.1 hypothetical protein [Kingella kingae]MBD3658869.1 hypothetical protein [Kingella kingae]MDK4529713.1 hypothetical protein [Kingella kingae]MDK4630263.1 hypothetical protein [Kingella kingae]
MKLCIANTPLILTDKNGVDFRVERGETVQLSAEQFEQVAAHVTEIATEKQPAQSAPEVTQPEKPKRNSKAEQ